FGGEEPVAGHGPEPIEHSGVLDPALGQVPLHHAVSGRGGRVIGAGRLAAIALRRLILRLLGTGRRGQEQDGYEGQANLGPGRERQSHAKPPSSLEDALIQSNTPIRRPVPSSYNRSDARCRSIRTRAFRFNPEIRLVPRPRTIIIARWGSLCA